MRKIWNRISEKPEYIFRPRQIISRLRYRAVAAEFPIQEVTLPWHMRMQVNLKEAVGKSIYLFGLYDLALTETIYRLVAKGDTVCDVGANIGYISTLLSYCAGGEGKVHSFELNPLLPEQLHKNIDTCSRAFSFANVSVQKMAVSHSTGST